MNSQLKYYILIITVLLLLSCKRSQNQVNKTKELSFRKIDDLVEWKGKAKLIKTYNEALAIGLAKKTIKAKNFYSENAVYLFEVGGGCFGASPNEISITLKNNLISINWQEPEELCPEVGEASAFYGEIIINKKDYPNYKKLKLKYYWEE